MINISKEFKFGEIVKVNGILGKIVGIGKESITIENDQGGKLHFDKSPIRIDRLDEDGNVVNKGKDIFGKDD